MCPGGAVADPPAPATDDELARKRAEAEGGDAGGDGEGAAAAGEGGEGEAPASEPANNGNGNTPSGDGDFPGEDEEEKGPPPIEIEGDGQLNLQVGGAKPDKATVKLRGGSIDIPAGQLKKGEVLNLLVKVKVAEVHLVDKEDRTTGELVETERRHVAKIMGVEKVV